jgi:mRNA interferase MazF
VVVSREALIDSAFSTVICAPVYTTRSGLSTQVDIGAETGLKHASTVTCDALVSIPKVRLTDYVGCLDSGHLVALRQALIAAIALENP